MNLKDEILGGESYTLEFKRVPNEDRIKYLKTVVAFANGKGGRILFGVANDGTVRGIARDNVFAEMDTIVDSISNACSPRIPIDVGIENVDGRLVIVVDVLAGATGGEAAKPKTVAKTHTGEVADATVDATVNATVSDVSNSNVPATVPTNVPVNVPANVPVSNEVSKFIGFVRAKPGRRTEFYAKEMGKTRRTIKRYVVLAKCIEFRGAPKTGGYYCKE